MQLGMHLVFSAELVTGLALAPLKVQGRRRGCCKESLSLRSHLLKRLSRAQLKLGETEYLKDNLSPTIETNLNPRLKR